VSTTTNFCFERPIDFFLLLTYLYALAVNSCVLFPSGAIVSSLNDAISVVVEIFESAEREIAFIVHVSNARVG
jgi:hypothetical protein